MSLLKSVGRELLRSLTRSRGESSDPIVSPSPGKCALPARSSPSNPEEAERRARAESACAEADELLAAGELGGAEASYRRALVELPMHGRSQEGLGMVLTRACRLDEAVLHFDVAHRADPMNAEVLTHWGIAELAMGNLGAANSRFQRAVERDPRNHAAWINLGLVRLKTGGLDGALVALRRAIELHPSSSIAHTNLAMALRRKGDLTEAIAAARRATEVSPQHTRGWVALGTLLVDASDLAEASLAVNRAAALAPEEPNVLVMQGLIASQLGQHESARAAFRRILERQPDHAEALNGLGQLELLLGEWAMAWDHYEGRRHIDATPVRRLPFPDWDGRADTEGSLLVHSEQGLGDIILFASCLADLQLRCLSIVLEVPLRLERLFRRSFPNIRIVGHDIDDATGDWLAPLGRFQWQAPIGSLPRWLRRSPADFGPAAPFLRADPAQIEQWRSRLQALPGRRIGIAWRAGRTETGHASRTVTLHLLARALAASGASLVCLQYGEVDGELQACASETGITVFPGLSGLADLDELAALMQALDGVVTVTSTLAHLAGALGAPALVLVPHVPSWRYGATGKAMAWYGSVTLARQPAHGDWSEPLAAAANWVAQLDSKPGSASACG